MPSAGMELSGFMLRTRKAMISPVHPGTSSLKASSSDSARIFSRSSAFKTSVPLKWWLFISVEVFFRLLLVVILEIIKLVKGVKEMVSIKKLKII